MLWKLQVPSSAASPSSCSGSRCHCWLASSLPIGAVKLGQVALQAGGFSQMLLWHTHSQATAACPAQATASCTSLIAASSAASTTGLISVCFMSRSSATELLYHSEYRRSPPSGNSPSTSPDTTPRAHAAHGEILSCSGKPLSQFDVTGAHRFLFMLRSSATGFQAAGAPALGAGMMEDSMPKGRLGNLALLAAR